MSTQRVPLPPGTGCGIFGSVTDNLELLSRATDQAGAVIDSVQPDQLTLITPCPDWNVEALLNHVVGHSMRNFITSARGETVNWQAPPEEVTNNWGGEFHRRAQTLLEIWRAADLDHPVPLPGGGERPLRSRVDQQIAELGMHTWDLARATSSEVPLDPEIAEYALAWSRTMLRPEFRGPDKAFGAELPAPDDAPAYERMAAWFGRDPHWTPSTEEGKA